jgi:NAD(P)-dependent dehydrogenase (short-subunit alcohol dehydrogenase family)
MLLAMFMIFCTCKLGTAQALAAVAPKILVLGGTGFVGGTIAKEAVQRGYSVTTISRRGGDNEEVDMRKGDATDPAVLSTVLQEGGYVAVIHAIGMLLESDLNKFASGSGSVPRKGSTFDEVTRQTAFNAIAAVVNSKKADQVSAKLCSQASISDLRLQLLMTCCYHC